jgi:solute carrier family 30 (zinc transporter), member 2
MIPSSANFHNNINMEAAYIHILTDIILSIGVIILASIIYFFAPNGHVWSYWQIADPLCTYLFSFLAIYSTMPIIKESLILLLDGCTNPQIVEEIEKAVNSYSVVKKVESLRIWSTNRGKVYGALRVSVGKGDTAALKNVFA